MQAFLIRVPPKSKLYVETKVKIYSYFRNVLYISEKPNQFQCDLCGKTTSSRAAMSKHNEIHGEKKYACEVVNIFHL